MAVTNIPNVQNWTVTPQNGQSGYFDLMNTWLGQSTLVIASLQSAITAQNLANSEINTLATDTNTARDEAVDARDEAVTSLAILSAGSINDTSIATNKAYSNSKSNTLLALKMDKDVNSLTAKTTPVDADQLVVADSVSTFSLKKVTFGDLKATLLTYFKTLFIQKDYVIISGSATFSPTNNTIVMTGIGSLGLKIGDVISITGSTGNNKTFNVENIFGDGTGRVTDLNTIIVNYEHRGTSTPAPSKRLIAGTSTVSITLITNPKEGDGLDWCLPATGRALGVTYTNSIGRSIMVAVEGIPDTSGASGIHIIVNGLPLLSGSAGVAGIYSSSRNFTSVVVDGTYSALTNSGSTTLAKWVELR